MARYTVTGGAGFIGSHLTEELLRRGHQVRVADNFSTGKRENIDAAVRASGVKLPAALEVVEGDLADLEVARRAVDGSQFVLHQAAIPSVPRSVKDPISSNRANIDGTLNVLVAARDAGVKRLVFAGSSSEYGDTPTLPKHEEMPTNPLSPYALQKVVGEEYLRLFTRLYGLETVSIRYFNVFGPRQDPGSPYSGVISLFIKWLLAGQTAHHLRRRRTDPRLHLRRQRRRRRAARVRSAGCVRRGDQRGDGGPHLAERAAGVLQGIIGTNLTATYGPPRVGDVRDSQASIEKARRLLGYAPIVPFEEGLGRTVAWFRES